MHHDKFKIGYSSKIENKYVFRAGVRQMLERIYEEDFLNLKKDKTDKQKFIEKWMKTI